ncbi:carbohydrate kinase [Actinopolymorpha sp. B11F2]|uniref:carbohydrate kinase family protein n=1 Tax=Actinopolymorpha sp. B11F2 TaxID=3160862 RepID=UPI0032E4F521
MITVIGEALIDLVGDGAVFQATPGGSPANVAVGLARLGQPCDLLCRISGDSFGARLREHLRTNGVSLRHAVPATEPTTLAIATLDPSGSAAYEFYVEGTADWQWTTTELPSPLPQDVVALHTGSLALAIDPGAAVLEEYLRRERERGAVTISLDPNVRPQLAPDRDASRRRIERQVSYAHVVKASAEDLGWLYPGEPMVDVVRHWCGLGPSLVVLTLGAEGALALAAGGELVEVSAPRVQVVDTVGAGDAFSAALLSGLADRDLLSRLRTAQVRTPEPGPDDSAVRGALPDVLRRACTAAALTCTRPGADPLTASELANATESASGT